MNKLDWIWANEKVPDTNRDVLVTDGYEIWRGYCRFDIYRGKSIRKWRVYSDFNHDMDTCEFDCIAWTEMPNFPSYVEFLTKSETNG